MESPTITSERLLAELAAVCAAHSYWFVSSDKAYDIFLFGVRNTKNPDTWNDTLGCVYRTEKGGPLRLSVWRGTADPGRPALTAPTNPAGTAVLAPGQHRAAWKIGTHRGRPALVQNRALPVLRDVDRDTDIDPVGTPVAGFYGINGHDAYAENLAKIGEASEGCVVWWRHEDHADMLRLVQAQERVNGWTSVSFTLFDVRDDPTLGAFLITW